MKKAVFKLQKANETQIDFEKSYKVVSKKKYFLYPAHNNPVFLGDKNPRLCCFCGEGEDKKTFKQLIDALPAFLGNRIYYSNEECDVCNQTYGKKCENELSKMLAPEKAIFSIPSRTDASPKHKKPNGDAYIGGSEFINNLSITVKEGDDSVKTIVDKENKKVTIETFSPAFNPVGAVQTLMRSMWFCMSKDLRLKYPIILDQIKSNSPILPLKFAKGIISGGDPSTAEFCVYELLDTSSDLPKMLCTYRIGRVFLSWGAPQASGYSELFPLPDIEAVYEDAPPPSITVMSILKNEKIKPNNSTFDFSFEHIVEGGLEQNEKPKKSDFQLNNEHQVILHINGIKNESFNGLRLRFLHEDETGYVHLISGKEFGVDIIFTVNENSLISKLRIHFKWDKVRVEDAKRTIQFLKNITSDSILSLENLDLKQSIELGKPDLNFDGELIFFQKYADALESVNKHSNNSFKMPSRIERNDYVAALVLAAFYEKRNIKFKENMNIELPLPVEHRSNIENDVKKGAISTSMSYVLFLLTKEFTIDSVDMIFKVLDPDSVRYEELDESTFVLSFTAEELLYIFNRGDLTT